MTSTSEGQARRAELMRRLTAMTPRSRLDTMLEEVDGRALVQAVPAEDVYAAIVDVGLADSAEVVQLSTPEQFRTFVDLAAWQKDRIDPLEVLRWLRAARGDDDEAFVRKLRGLDLEVLELVYKKLTVIHDLEEDPDVNPAGVSMEMPEGRYLVELQVDGADEAALRRLTNDLMAQNPFELGRFLEAVRWELPTELEETAFQFRQARLQDLGFPPLEEAAKVFAFVDPDKLAPRTVAGLAASTHVDHVSAAFKGLDAVERANLEGEVRYVVSCALVAEGAEPGDPPSVRRYSEHARDYLDLGLEHLTGGNPELASQVVRERPLKEIFQLGFSLTLRLKRQVERMASEPGAKFGETWLALDEESAALAALLRRRPLRALKVPGAEPVPFRARRELAEAEAMLARVRGQRGVLNALLGSSPAQVIAGFGVSLAELRPQRLFAAVVARAEVDGVVDVAPFPALRLPELCERLFAAGPAVTLRPTAGRRALEALTAKLVDRAQLEPMIERVLGAFSADLGERWVRDAKVDPRRVESLPIAGTLPV